MSGVTWHDYMAATWLSMRKTRGKWGERDDKSEMKIFCQNILEKKEKRKRILESERKFHLTRLKSKPFLVLEDQFVGGVEERQQKEKGKRKRKGKVKIKGKVKKK